MQAVHLLQRATYGPRAGDIERVLEMGVEGWLDWQMMPEAIDDSALEERPSIALLLWLLTAGLVLGALAAGAASRGS